MSIPEMPAEMLEVMSPERWFILLLLSGWAMTTLARRYFKWSKARREYKELLSGIEKSVHDNAVFKTDNIQLAGKSLLVMTLREPRLPGHLRMMAPMPEDPNKALRLADKMSRKLVRGASARIAVSIGKEVKL